MKKLILSIALVISTLLSAQERELRGIWVVTAWGLDWPSTQITSAGNAKQIAAQKSELTTILDNAKECNLNTIFFQVRGHVDALYKSKYEPWSKVLTGMLDKDPGYDPLQFAIDEAHKRGLELHAWVNPYRTGTNRNKNINDKWVITPNIKENAANQAFLDPSNPDVQKYTMNVICEIIDNYDIDGLVFDDYFYKGVESNEYATNETHINSNNNPHNLSINNWRRENVNKFIGDVMNYIKSHKPYMRFGVAPFGIWSTSNHYVYDENYKNSEEISAAAGISGQDAYSELYCDAATWLKRGYIDYISPQLYWPTTSVAQNYGTLCKWWSDLANRYNRHFITSNDVTRSSNDSIEISKQININRINSSYGALFYRTNHFLSKGYYTKLKKEHYKNISIQPAITWRTAPDAPTISNLYLDKNNDKLTWKSSGNNVKYAVYSYANELTTEQGCINENLVGITYINEFNTTKFTDKHEQKWAVRVLDRYGNLYVPIEYPSNVKPIEKAYILGINGWVEIETNLMDEQNGIYTKKIKLPAGSYTFKLKKGERWYSFDNVDTNNSTPGYYSDGKDKNIRFILSTKTDVTFTLNGDKILIKAIGIERFSPITYLLGINGWDTVSKNEMPILNGVFAKKETLPANKYSFKIKQDNKWFGIDNISKEESTTGYTSDKDGNICFELPIETEVSFYFSNGTIVLFAQSLDQFGPKQPDLDPIEPSNGIGELRGLYIRTELDNRDWPLSYDIEKQKKDLVNFIKKAKEGNLNAVIIQVRSFCDAIYDSKYEPWSEFLTKQRGKNPGYDPLDFAIQEAHKHGLELHAWISPFRIGAYTNDINIKKEWIISSATANKYNCLDPGNKEVRDYTINVLKDLISRYDIDGLLFDDYFYNKPNSNNETQPIVNINNPHNLSLDDWRRENVNIFISEVQKLINNTKPYLRFGISPIGIYNTSKVVIYDENYSYSEEILPAKGISGTGAYNTTYTDAATLLKRGYIDYISPQLIWPSLETSNDYRKGQDYTILCNWWSVLAKRFNRHLITNNEIEKAKWSNRMNNPKEISNQIQINRKDNISNGTILTRASYYINLEGINTNFASTNDGFHTYLPQHEFNTKSLWPAMTWKSKPTAYKIYDVIEDIENDHISWKCNHKDARFAIYCYPMEMSKSEGCTDEYLVDVTYSSSYKVSSMPDEYGSTRKMSICPIDRYGNRYIVENESSTPVNNEIHKENHFLVYNHGNNLFIELDEKLHNVTIFTVMGQVIYNDIINSNINIILPENIYIVKIDETAQKIIIK